MSKRENFESIEWTNTWFENQGETDKKRILFIGDSIISGAKPFLKELFNDEYYTDFFLSSRAIESELYKKELFMNLSYCEYDFIFFNHGLHGGYMTDKIYEEHYKKTILKIKEVQKKAKLVLGLSTPVTNGIHKNEYRKFNDEVLKRNEAVKRISKKYDIHLIDCYTLVDKNTDIKSDDGYHYTDEGYKIIADKIAENIAKIK